MMYADVCRLKCDVIQAFAVVPSLMDKARTGSLPGTVRGIWVVENGTLGEVVMVRTFNDLGTLFADHEEQYAKSAPFDLPDGVMSFTLEAHKVFDFAEPLPDGEHGGIYEIRTYDLKVGGLAPTLDGWRTALPGRTSRSPLAIGMSSIDGTSSITHIWPFKDANERMRVRAELYSEYLWPPSGGPESIALGTSTIALPVDGSPWH